jgi:hypothetical protein
MQAGRVNDLPTEVYRVVQRGVVMGITGACAARSAASCRGWNGRSTFSETKRKGLRPFRLGFLFSDAVPLYGAILSSTL